MADAQLGQERVDRTNLNAVTTAGVAQRSRFDVIRSIRDEEGKRREPIQDLLACLWSRETLQKLLQHQAGRQDRFAVFNRLNQSRSLWSRRRSLTSERKGPNTGINEETQLRERSVL